MSDMCTMTWLRRSGRYHVFFNRDERPTRGSAAPPAPLRAGQRRFIAPLDADFGGTWLAVNEAGLTLALHNARTDPPGEPREPAGGYTSRGLLVTSLAGAGSVDEVRERLLALRLDPYRAFLLTAFEPDGLPRLARWNGHRLSFEEAGESALPLLSSSFATEQVRTSRADLFRRLSRESELDPVERHLAFHESHLPARGAYSPCMHRPDASTVSFSWVRVGRDEVEFRYSPRSPCLGRPGPEGVKLPRIRVR